MVNFKQRPRAHIIADLSVNYLERFFLKEGHVVERPQSGNDYGYDLTVRTFKESRYESGPIYVQLKATDKLPLIAEEALISFAIGRDDIDLWQDELNTVILVIYDARLEKAYWLHARDYISATSFAKDYKTVNVHIPISQIISEAAVQLIVEKKRISIAGYIDYSKKIDK